MTDKTSAGSSNYGVGALRARLADESMPWTRPHIESLIERIETLTQQRDEGWQAFYNLRKQVADERFPGMTAPVRLAPETNAEPSLLNITRGQLDFTMAVTGNARISGLTKAQFLHMVTLAWDARDAVKANEGPAADLCEKHGVGRFFAGGCPECYREKHAHNGGEQP